MSNEKEYESSGEKKSHQAAPFSTIGLPPVPVINENKPIETPKDNGVVAKKLEDLLMIE